MRIRNPLTLFIPALLLSLVFMPSMSAQGPDVIVGAITGPSNYSSVGGIDAFAVGTTSCNIGTTNLSWVGSTSLHPVIAQNLYRLKNDRFEQIGMAWLKHGFASLQGSLCTPCTGTGNGSALGVGCSDPYGSGLNGYQNPLGARSEITASTGVFPYPRQLVPPYFGSIARRLQAKHVDIDPALNPGARYFTEAHYVAADDAASGNLDNNASYREAVFSGSGSEFSMALVGPTEREDQAILAWQVQDPSVVIHHIDIPGDGRMTLGFKVTFAPNGDYRYTYALHNFNSDRSGHSFSVQLPTGSPLANAANPGFHDVDYHSGELHNGIDWYYQTTANGVSWTCTQSWDPNPGGQANNDSANALRWGTMYTFWFDSPDVAGDVTLGLFKPGTSATFTIPAGTLPIPTPDWQMNQPEASLDLDGLTNTALSGAIAVSIPVGMTTNLNLSSSLSAAPFDIFVTAAPAVPALLTLPSGQMVNINLLDPTMFPINNYFGAVTPGFALSFPVSLGGPATIAAQMAVINPTGPDGLALSAAVEITATTCVPSSITHTMADDSFVQVTVGAGGDHECISGIPFFGAVHNSFYINSNGSVSFVAGHTDYTASTSEFFSQSPRFAGLWSDLNPAAGGTITSADNVAGVLTVSFTNVPMYAAASTTSSFDLEFDTLAGTCALLNYAPNPAHNKNTLVGLSPGGGASGSNVVWSALAGLGLQGGVAVNAIYQYTLGGPPTGFTSILFSASDGSLYTVN